MGVRLEEIRLSVRGAIKDGCEGRETLRREMITRALRPGVGEPQR